MKQSYGTRSVGGLDEETGFRGITSEHSVLVPSFLRHAILGCLKPLADENTKQLQLKIDRSKRQGVMSSRRRGK